MDPGTVVNKDRVHSQMEGAVVMGISNALYGGITMKNGVAEQTNFRDARIARMRDVPPRSTPTSSNRPSRRAASASRACRRSVPRSPTRSSRSPGKRIREIPLAKALKN